MSKLAISLLGPFEVTLEGEPVTRFGADSARALLAYLAMHPHTAHRRETLAGLLWPDQPETEARHNLAQALNRLRQAIGDRTADPPFLDITRQTIQLCLDSDPSTGQSVWVDVTAFREALAACRGHRHRRVETCEPCARWFAEVVELYRGPFLEGFSLDSALYEEWMVVEREELHQGVLEALQALAGIHETEGTYDEAVACGRRQIEMEPWREVAHRQVMRALALSGERAGALAQYEACCHVLKVELGVQPEPETTALYERIRAGEELETPSALSPHNLPVYLTRFVGREDVLSQIAAHLADPECRLLTLVGPGGIGKTRLAVEAVRGLVGQYRDGVFFVPLAAVSSKEGIVSTVAQAIGLSFYGASEGGRGGDPKQQLLDYLRRRQMLLILDNFEHLLIPSSPPGGSEGGDGSAASLVTEMLRAAPGVQILTTTRARLNVRGEHLLPIDGMRYPETRDKAASDLDQYSAVRLFFGGAREIRPDFGLTTEDLVHVAHICHLVEGMPLAILLASAWVGMLSPAEIANEIEQGIDFLAADWRDVPERQRSMRAVFDRSWHLLSDREREVLAGLSVFRGGCTRQAAEQVVDTSLRELMALVDRSLLYRASSGRFETHELLRQYAEEKLAQDPDREETVRDRHCAYYVAALQQWGTDLNRPREQRALAEMEPEIENACAAWDWAVERDEIARLDQAMKALIRFHEFHQRIDEGVLAFRKAAQRLSTQIERSPIVSADSVRVLAKVLSAQGLFEEQLEIDEQLQRQSLALLEGPQLAGHDVRSEKASILQHLGVLCDPNGLGRDPAAAERFYAQSHALYQDLADHRGMARALRGLANVAWNAGEFDRARRLFEEGLELSRVADSPERTCGCLGTLGFVYLHQGQLEQGERVIRESLTLAEEAQIPWMIAHLRRHVGTALCYQGRFAEARPLLERSLALNGELFDRGLGLAGASFDLGKVEMHLGQYERAHSLGDRGLALAREMGVNRQVGLCLLLLGEVALVQGRFLEACSCVQEGVAVLREIGHMSDLALTLVVLACADRSLGKPDEAWQSLSEALHIGSKTQAFRPNLYGLVVYALLLVDREENEHAVELYALALTYGHVANSRWFGDVVGKHIAAAAETLPPAVVAAAQERGRARDLWATVEEVLEELTHSDST